MSSFQDLEILALEEAQNEDAIRKLWMETGRSRLAYAVSHILVSLSACAYVSTQDKMKRYCETAGLHEETRVAENVPHLHAIKAAVNGECDYRISPSSSAQSATDVERVANGLYEQDG